ncbi:MAG: hypothetical protein CMP57_03895 [Flavobacteriales bacterium]|nr:hypothetical protein [Flavobacteriales bacterium]
MKPLNKLLTLFCILSFFTCLGQVKRDSVRFESTYYSGIYSEVKEQPLYIKYRVINCGTEGFSRKGLSFYGCDSIHTSNNGDYYNNIWDRGHIVPAASQNCFERSIRETFSFLNVSLQHSKLNQGVWKQLEDYERQLAWQYERVDVEVSIEFKNNQWLKTGALIPSGFYKTLYLNGKRSLVFYFKNTIPRYSSYEKYRINHHGE